jgi:hypothetical protein
MSKVVPTAVMISPVTVPLRSPSKRFAKDPGGIPSMENPNIVRKTMVSQKASVMARKILGNDINLLCLAFLVLFLIAGQPVLALVLPSAAAEYGQWTWPTRLGVLAGAAVVSRLYFFFKFEFPAGPNGSGRGGGEGFDR